MTQTVHKKILADIVFGLSSTFAVQKNVLVDEGILHKPRVKECSCISKDPNDYYYMVVNESYGVAATLFFARCEYCKNISFGGEIRAYHHGSFRIPQEQKQIRRKYASNGPISELSAKLVPRYEKTVIPPKFANDCEIVLSAHDNYTFSIKCEFAKLDHTAAIHDRDKIRVRNLPATWGSCEEEIYAINLKKKGVTKALCDKSDAKVVDAWSRPVGGYYATSRDTSYANCPYCGCNNTKYEYPIRTCLSKECGKSYAFGDKDEIVKQLNKLKGEGKKDDDDDDDVLTQYDHGWGRGTY